MRFRLGLASALMLGLTPLACVTINIYFPAAAAEKAADRIIDEVWQIRKDAASPASGEPSGKEGK